MAVATLQTSARRPRTATRRKPDLLLYVVVLFIWISVWRIQEFWPILAKIQLPILTELATVVLFVSDVTPVRKVKWIFGPILIAIGVLFAIMVIGLPFSLWPGKGLTFIEKDFLPSMVLMIVIATSMRDLGDLEWLAFAHMLGAMVYAAWVYLFIPVGAGGRLGGLVFYDANDFALLLVCTLPFCVYFLRPGVSAFKRGTAIFALLLFIIMLIKSGSRGGFLGLLAVAAYTLVRYGAIPARLRLGAVAGGALILVVFASSNYWQMMGTIVNPEGDYNLTEPTGRKAVWKRGIGYMLHNPVLGTGIRTFPQAEGHLSKISKEYAARGKGLKWSVAHNSFIEVGAETGMIGLTAFIFILGLSFRATTRTRAGPKTPLITPVDQAFAQMLTAALIGYCVSGFWVSAEYFSYLYVILGLVLAQQAILRRRRATGVTAVATVTRPQKPRPERALSGDQPHWFPAA